MEKLEYKGLIGTIEYSEEDKVWFGRVLCKDLVSYEANTKEELQKSFEEAVDDYYLTD